MFWQMTKAMGSDWGKLVKKAEQNGWTKLVDSVNEAPDDKIQVRGIGMYTYDTLKKDVIRKAEDLYKNAKAGKWSKISRNGLRAYAELWHALSEYERKR